MEPTTEPTLTEAIDEIRRRRVAGRIIPARIVLDGDEQTGEEFAYEWKSRVDNQAGEWLNLTNEQYYSDEFVKRLELDVLYVEFAGLREIMTGVEWREQGSPRFLKG